MRRSPAMEEAVSLLLGDGYRVDHEPVQTDPNALMSRDGVCAVIDMGGHVDVFRPATCSEAM